MKINTSIMRYIVAALVAVVLGGLAGWYMFVNRQIGANDALDAARGLGSTQTFSGDVGSTLSNLVGGVIGDIMGTGEKKDGPAPKLWQITRTPVAGLGFASSSPRLYFAERASGNILIADPGTAKVERLTNTLIPRVLEASFAADGSVVLRSLDESGAAVSYAAKIATSTSPAAGDTPNKLEGVYLPEGIVSLSTRSSPNELFFILRESTGAAGITSDWLGGAQKRIFSSALSDWKAIELRDGTRYIVQKASDGVSGHAFKLGAGGVLERLMGDLPGLTILPRTNSSALMWSTSNGGVTLFARTGAQNADIRLPVRTIAEKCVWAPGTGLVAYCAVPVNTPSGTFLRDWYDGSAHTSDAWWRIDVSANSAEQIYTPEVSTLFDVEYPQMDAGGKYIAFMNAADKTLWMLTLDN